MNTLTFNDSDVQDLSLDECREINGGMQIPKWVKGITPVAVAAYIIDNWTEIKKGISDGWNLQ